MIKKDVGLVFVAAGLVLLVSVGIGVLFHSLPPSLALALIVLPSVITVAYGVLGYHAHQDHVIRHEALVVEFQDLRKDVRDRLTLLLVTNGDEQRKLGQAEGAASVPPVDQLTITTAAAAAVASVVAAQATANADAAKIAKQLVEDAVVVAAQVEATRAARAVTLDNKADARLQTIAQNTAATVQAIKDNHPL